MDESYRVEKVLEDSEAKVLNGITTVRHDVRTGRLFMGGESCGFLHKTITDRGQVRSMNSWFATRLLEIECMRQLNVDWFEGRVDVRTVGALSKGSEYRSPEAK